jgi:hypothetical protein
MVRQSLQKINYYVIKSQKSPPTADAPLAQKIKNQNETSRYKKTAEQ